MFVVVVQLVLCCSFFFVHDFGGKWVVLLLSAPVAAVAGRSRAAVHDPGEVVEGEGYLEMADNDVAMIPQRQGSLL